MTPPADYDVLHMGRSSIDLYSADIGAAFPDITSFSAYLGGSPTNISVGARRLGLRTALLTAVGDDPVGDFVLSALNKEDVETAFIPRKPGHRTSAVILGIEPPDRFPLVFYRENCADLQLTIDDVLAAPVARSRILQIAGTNLSREPSRSATIMAAELARRAGREVVLDIDFRPDQWSDPRAFGLAVRSLLHLVDIVIGTEDEINAAMLDSSGQISMTRSQVSDAHVSGDTAAAVDALLEMGPTAVVEKRGEHGARVHLAQAGGQSAPEERSARASTDVPGFPVEVRNILGAGDGFASGFLYGRVHGWDLAKAARLGNACGAILVTEHGCANFMPTYDEAMAFADRHGGL